MRNRTLAIACFATLLVGCVGLAGIGDYSVDPCFDGCSDSGNDTGSSGNDGSSSGDSATDGPPGDTGVDAPPPSPGLSSVTSSGTGVEVGKSGVITLITKNASGDVVPRTGAKVVFTATAGTSVLSFGAVTDLGGGTYTAKYTGVTEGTKLNVSATLDGAPLTTVPASVRVANVVAAGRTFWLDVENADGAGNFGGKACAASGLTTWKSLTGAFSGNLANFAAVPCAAGAGWNGTGTPQDPFRLALDGAQNYVDFGAIDTITKQTLIAWIRKTGDGFTGTSGAGGLTQVTPILTKGTAEMESEPLDINFYLGIASTGELATDYEATGTSTNNTMVGATILANDTWYMVAMTLDVTVGQRFLYLNGKQDGLASAVTVAPASGSTSLLTVGGARRTDGAGAVTCPGAMGSTGCGRFQGEIAEVITYDHALTVAEIEKNCHALSSRFGMITCPN